MLNKRVITRTVLLLALVSFFTDIASEMLYPVLPLYVKGLGYSIAFIGLLEASVQLASGFFKVFVGAYSDTTSNRSLFIKVGYGLSAFAKPLMALTPGFWTIYSYKMLDRLGKGIRTAPRDALLSDESTPKSRGQIFAFHRAFDTLGATLGPRIALLVLFFAPTQLKTVILLTAIPGGLALAISFKLKKQTYQPAKERVKVRSIMRNMITFARASSPIYKRILLLILLAAIVKSTDVYLLLRAQELGLSASAVISVYILYNAVQTLTLMKLTLRKLSFDFKKLYGASLFALALCYALLAQKTTRVWLVVAAFVLYAFFVAIFDGINAA